MLERLYADPIEHSDENTPFTQLVTGRLYKLSAQPYTAIMMTVVVTKGRFTRWQPAWRLVIYTLTYLLTQSTSSRTITKKRKVAREVRREMAAAAEADIPLWLWDVEELIPRWLSPESMRCHLSLSLSVWLYVRLCVSVCINCWACRHLQSRAWNTWSRT